MKKIIAMIMALALVLSCTAAFAKNERQAYSWAKALPQGATFMFDYSYMQPVQAVKIPRGQVFGALAHTNSKDEALKTDKDGTAYELWYDPETGIVEEVLAGNDPTSATAVQIFDDFAHMSKAEIAWYNKQYDEGNMDPLAANNDSDGYETLWPASVQRPTAETDNLEATFTWYDGDEATIYPFSDGLRNKMGVEYWYSDYAPWDDAWSDRELSTLAYYDEVVLEDGTTKYVYVNKEVSNTPGANVATTLNRTNNYISSAFVAGFLKNELNPDASSNEKESVVPVDLSQDGTYVYPIVSKAHTIVGLVWATVADGFVTIDGQLRDQVTKYFNYQKKEYEEFTLSIYTTTADLAKKGTAFELGTEISIEEELGGASALYFGISGKVQYHWAIGASKVGNTSVYWTLQDYWRNEVKWKIYRNGLNDIAALVAAE